MQHLYIGREAKKERSDAAADFSVGGLTSLIVGVVGENGSAALRSFIDFDEVDALLKGLDYISKATSEVTKLGMFEATYKTKGYFSATTFSSSSGKIDAALKSGTL